MTTLTATGQVLAGRYTLLRWVAGGVMAEVWEARDERMDRTVAVKVLRPTYTSDAIALERFRNEAKLGARLDHPGIAKVLDVNSERRGGEPPWMVQEYIAGSSLADLLGRTSRLEPERAANIIAQAAEAVHSAHELGVVHRDLTPRNLLVTGEDVVKVTDFGIARADGLQPLTMTGQVVGAPAYMSPEQVRGTSATPVSDVYTLGIVLYECVAGIRPFDGRNPIEVARAHLDQDPPPLPTSVPLPMRELVASALAKDPEQRPRSAAELAARLHAAAPGSHRTKALPALTPPAAPPATTEPAAAPATGPGVVRFADTARRSTERAGERARHLIDQALPVARRTWTTAWPHVVRTAHAGWQRRPVTGVGLAGLAVLLLAVVAVLRGGAA